MKSPRKTIRVLIADDHPMVRKGLAAVLQSQNDIEVVAEATDGEEALDLYARHSPDVLILDLRMPEKDGLQVITELMAFTRPKPRIVVVTTYETEEDIRLALQAGAKGYLVKGALPRQILETVRRVAEGKSLLPATVAAKLAKSLAHPKLTAREFQVLRHIATGSSDKEIGQKLKIALPTVRTHVQSILAKLDAMGRTEAIAIAKKRGLLRRS